MQPWRVLGALSLPLLQLAPAFSLCQPTALTVVILLELVLCLDSLTLQERLGWVHLGPLRDAPLPDAGREARTAGGVKRPFHLINSVMMQVGEGVGWIQMGGTEELRLCPCPVAGDNLIQNGPQLHWLQIQTLVACQRRAVLHHLCLQNGGNSSHRGAIVCCIL